MFYRLAPAGNKITCGSKVSSNNSWFNSFLQQAFFFNSGAASLSAAVLAAMNHLGKDAAEVILPAYACPELVGAVLYAGATPVLIDLEANSPWLDLDALSAAVTENTVAVIAVNLFGIPERFGKIRSTLHKRNVYVIEDSAQGFPEPQGLNSPHSDMVIFSFGRGKPVSLLGGGSVVINRPELAISMNEIAGKLSVIEQSKHLLKCKIHLYNCLSAPRCYWLLDMLPFIGLGTTIFHPLEGINQIDEHRLAILKENVVAYWGRGWERQHMVASEIVKFESVGLVDLALHCCRGSMPRLLRYPLLVETSAVRDYVYDKLNEAGLGASKMYQASLPGIKGLEGRFQDREAYPNAESFAGRLLTLPLHESVTQKDITTMCSIIRRI